MAYAVPGSGLGPGGPVARGSREDRLRSEYAQDAPATRDASFGLGLGRIESFSDAVFAFAITLLALNLAVPEAASVNSNADLWRRLADEKLKFVAYLLSFLFIGEIWISHRRLFGNLRRADHWLLWLNIGLMADVVFIPFATALLGTYANRPAQVTAALVYGGTWTIGGIFFNAIWLYASHHRRLVRHDLSQSQRRAITLHWAVGPCFYFLSTLLALVSFWLAAAGFVVLGVLYIVPLQAHRRPPRPAPTPPRYAAGDRVDPGGGDRAMIATTVEDRLAVIETCTRMGWHADRRDWSALAGVFDDVVMMDYTSLNGGQPAQLTPDQIVARWSGLLGNLEATQHLIANHLVDVTGDRAVCTAAFQATHLLPNRLGDPTWTLGGTYRFELRRRGPGDWRIASVVMTAEWATGNQNVLALAAAAAAAESHA